MTDTPRLAASNSDGPLAAAHAAAAARARGEFPAGWGAWLHSFAEEDEGWNDWHGLTDLEDGARYDDLRDAFWTGSLHMLQLEHWAVDHDALERIRAMLIVADRRYANRRERVADIAEGSDLAERLLTSTCLGADLASPGDSHRDLYQTTPEGAAVLRMLLETGPLADRLDASPTLVECIGRMVGVSTAGDDEPDDRVTCMRDVEDVSPGWQDAFARVTVRGCPAVALLTRISAPSRRDHQLWTRTFDDDHARDELFSWLCDRLDRWHDWAEHARGRGSASFDRWLTAIMEAAALDDAAGVRASWA